MKRDTESLDEDDLNELKKETGGVESQKNESVYDKYVGEDTWEDEEEWEEQVKNLRSKINKSDI